MGTLGAWTAWWLTGRLVLQGLCGRVPALALTDVTCQRSRWLCCTEHGASCPMVPVPDPVGCSG